MYVQEVAIMRFPEATLPRTAHGPRCEQGLWLHSKRWDLCYITGSSILVMLPLFVYAVVGKSATFVNLLIAGSIGGPHMYATFFRTLWDRSFRRHYRLIFLSSFGIPLAVIAGALWHFQLLITVFFFLASIHVLHQIAYILVCYDHQQAQLPSRWARCIDYAVIFSSLYPFASYRFIHDEFYIGDTLLLYPEFLKTPMVCYIVSSFFGLALFLFIGKTCREIVLGTIHYPKLALMVATLTATLFITSHSGPTLEIAFQGFNTWHSVQYLALTWHIMTRRRQRGEIASQFLYWLAEPRTSRFAMFYGLNGALTGMALLLIGLLWHYAALPFEHCYYIVVLSFLLVHYYHDHILFTQFEACR